MRYLISLLLSIPFLTTAQTQKSAIPLAPSTVNRPPSTVTRAVVVGISDYQDLHIPDLQYADKDAEAFADWLKSPAGGLVPAENIQLLTDEKATIGQFAMALEGLLDECKPGERAIIYFSGHGDVETKTAFQLGFLLCYDSKAQNYMAGAFNLYNLQAVVSTLAQNNVQVTVISDACHAGKLAGNAVGGAQLTSANLAKQIANEYKILSCQANEFSVEGPQWGGGRGAFSYNLVDGLTGLADKNNDAVVNLFEIGRYLQDVVPAETAPQPQMPFTMGDLQGKVSWVDANALAQLKSIKSAQTETLNSISSKGFFEGADSASLALYHAFQRALENHELITPIETSAWNLYQKCLEKQDLESLHRLMRRNLAAALLDVVQQALNAVLESDPYEVNQWRYNPGKYADYPLLLEKAIELLGKDHYTYPALAAKKYYFEAYALIRKVNDEEIDPAGKAILRADAKEKLLSALQMQPNAAYLYHLMAVLYVQTIPYQTDSVAWYCEKAILSSPAWLLPYVDIAQEYLGAQSRPDISIRWLEKALAVEPGSFIALERYAWALQNLNRPAEAVPVCQKMIALRPDLNNGYSTLASVNIQMQDYEQAEPLARKGAEIDTLALWWSYTDLGRVFNRTRRFDEAERHLTAPLRKQSLDFVSKLCISQELAFGYTDTRQYDKAAPFAKTLINQNNTEWLKVLGLVQLGRIRFFQGKFEVADSLFKAALAFDPTVNVADNWAYAFLGLLEEKKGHPAAAETLLSHSGNSYQANQSIPIFADCAFLYGGFLLRQNRIKEAYDKFFGLTQSNPLDYRGYYGLALLAAKRGDNTAALDYLEHALDRYYPSPQPLLEEPLFKKIRSTRRFKTLLIKHFPDFKS